MSFEYIQKIPTAVQICDELPLRDDLKMIKAKRDKAIKSIFERKSDKFLVIVGPCSADNEDAVCEYVTRLAKIQDKVRNQLLLVPRIYTNKPRTMGEGYKGMAHQPVPTEAPDIVGGLIAIRKMHLRVLAETHLPAADEMLYPANYPYLEDVLSYVAIGARSVENQQHRLTVSGFDIPAGMKNPTSGDLNVMLNAVHAAQKSHDFIYHEWEVKTSGNPYAHCIVRGATDYDGVNIPNYGYDDLCRLADLYAQRDLTNPTIIVDTNHANSGKNYAKQPEIVMDVLKSMRKSSMIKGLVRGLMIESYLIEGVQDFPGATYGKSITDPCLGIEATERLLMDLAEKIT